MVTIRAAAAALALAAGSTAAAQNLQAITVPWVATDPTIPHAAYNGHATTFKAIARGGNGTYVYEWDFQGDGTLDFSATTTNRYNLSTRFTYPYQGIDTTFQATVRVSSNGQTVVATYPVRVFADVPANPAAATSRQLQVMRDVAIDDGLWFLHNSMSRSGNDADPLAGAQITGNIGGSSTFDAGMFLEVLGMNGHSPAFPAAYLGELPDPAANAARWASDPYAEDAARLVNYLLSQAQVVAVAAADEDNRTGFYPEISATPILGTDDAIGLFIGANTGDQTNGYHSAALRGLARANLAGFVAQTGDPNRILGRRFEHVVQQMVDALVWSQNDGGSFPGSWYYTPNGMADLLGELTGGGALEAAQALLVAERSMGTHGVIVPNLAKARVLSYLQLNARACSVGGYAGIIFTWTSPPAGACDFAVTSAHVVAQGWVGANQFSSADTRLAFPSYNAITRGTLRTAYDRVRTYIDSNFGGVAAATTSFAWDVGFVDASDFARVDGRGNHWAMLQWTRAARAVEPEIALYGANDHARLFGGYLIRNQATDGGWNWNYGATNPNNDNGLGARVRAAAAVEILSRDAQAPVAVASAAPTTAPEGSPVTFDASALAGDAEYLWSFGDGQAAAGARVTHAYPDNGIFNAAVTVTTPGGTSIASVPITITNVAPIANAGPDLAVDEGSPASLLGTFTDPGAGDTHTFAWSFGDGRTANTAAANPAFADQGSHDVSFRVTDDDGGTSQDIVAVTVRNVAPSITSTPPATTPEGAAFGYAFTWVDPGVLDSHACSAPVMPAGATLTDCAVSWTPTFAHLAAPADFKVCVADGDGGSGCQSFEVAVTAVDSDADGLPDTWETHFFGGLAAQTGAGDADLDGVSNQDEYLASSDPTRWDGPGAPVLLAPSCGARLATARPILVAGNALDAREGTTLTYEFEVHDDAGATSLVAAGHLVPAGPGYTSWQLDVTLGEDRTYYWRARAGDGAIFGPWTAAACSFVVDAVTGHATLSTTDDVVGGACDTYGNGGQRTRTGLDDGDGDGTADDGILQPGEVDALTITCNGADGATGPQGPAGEQGPAGAAGSSGGCGSVTGGAAAWPALLVLVALALRPGRRVRASPRRATGGA